MKRSDIEQNYDVRNGTIKSPGKFEAEPVWAPAFWERGMDGFADHDIDRVWFFGVTDEDRAEWPELAGVYGVSLEESDQGFVGACTYQTQTEYEDEVNAREAAETPEDE